LLGQNDDVVKERLKVGSRYVASREGQVVLSRVSADGAN